jgi:hypothetical protein
LARNSHLVLVYREFAKYGITNHRLDENRGKHNQLSWSFGRISNILTVPKTPSDHRAPLNLLSDLRRQIKSAHLTPVAERPNQKHLQLVSSKPTDNLLEKKVAGLAEDVDALADLILDIAPDLSRFAQVAARTDAVAQDFPIKFRVQAEVPPALAGPLLAYLIANGVAMRDVRISSLKAATPEVPTREPAPTCPLPSVVEPARPLEGKAPTIPARPPVPKKPGRPGPPFAGSALCKLMQYLRDNGPQTTLQLGVAGFTGYAGRADRLGAFAYGLVQRGLAMQKPDRSWALTIEGRSKLKAERL